MIAGYQQRRQQEQLDRAALEQWQLRRLDRLLQAILPTNRFYRQKLAYAPATISTWDDFRQIPFTTKDELLTDTNEGFAANLTYPVERYVHFHRTSGTRGKPMAVLDTAEDWQWWMDCWQYVLDVAEVTSFDRVILAFSFGPFIGFWSAYDACVARGALVVPTGGMTTRARLELMANLKATCVLCTPSYALHMAEVARGMGLPLAQIGVRCLIVAGEPGGSVPAVRERIQAHWGAKVVDHSGATEVGAWGYGDEQGEGLYVNESEFIAEFLPVDGPGGSEVSDGQLAELVLTSLGRYGCPVLRYRTGDLVRPVRHHNRRNRFVFLPGGVLGRVDEMVIVRGVNVFPSAIESVLREFPEVTEFRVTVYRAGELDAMRIEVEDQAHEPKRIAELVQRRIGLRAEVVEVPHGSLPRFEAKGKRFFDERPKGWPQGTL